MNSRLQKKCFIAAVGFHLLMLVILLVGPAFLSSRRQPDAVEPSTFVASILIEQAISGGGNPQAQTPARQQPQAPQPPQPRVEQREPEAPPERKPEPRVKPAEPKTAMRDPNAVSSKPKPSPRKLPDVTLKPISRPKNNNKSKNPTSDNANAANDRAKQIANAARAAAQAVREGLSGATTVQMSGIGGGGPTYASYNSEVARIYKERYDLALAGAGDIAEDETLIVEASVTIASNGDVLSARVTIKSRSHALNEVVQRVLDSIKHFRAFPEGSKDPQRTLTILFDLKPKKAIG